MIVTHSEISRSNDLLAVFTSSCDLIVYNLADVHSRQIEKEQEDKLKARESMQKSNQKQQNKGALGDTIKRRTYGKTLNLQEILKGEVG